MLQSLYRTHASSAPKELLLQNGGAGNQSSNKVKIDEQKICCVKTKLKTEEFHHYIFFRVLTEYRQQELSGGYGAPVSKPFSPIHFVEL